MIIDEICRIGHLIYCTLIHTRPPPVTTLNYCAIVKFHVLQFIIAHANYFPALSPFTCSCLVTAPTMGPTVSESVHGAHEQMFITLWQLRSCLSGAPSLARGRGCLLYMPLALGSVVFLRSEPLGTRDHILLCQIWDFPFRRLLRLAGSRWRYSFPVVPVLLPVETCLRLLPGDGSTRYITVTTVSPYFKDKENSC
jgi:hypothetical protein